MNPLSFARRWMLAVLLPLLLAGCGTLQVEVERTATPDPGGTATVTALELQNQMLNAQVATLAAPQDETLSPASDSETIRHKLLTSSSHWRTLWADAMLNSFTSAGTPDPAQAARVQLWIDQNAGRFRLVWGSTQSQVDGASVSDGVSVRRLDVTSGQISGETLPDAARQVFIPPGAGSESIVQHPLTGIIGSPLADQVLSTALAQRGGSFTAQAMDEAAGRSTLVADWTTNDGARVDRFWIDAQTGVVLRWQNFGKSGGGQVQHEYVINSIQYDAEFPSELFDQQLLSNPYFAGGWQGNPEPAAQSMVEQATTAQDEQGELYFTLRDPKSGSQSLVMLPGSCLSGARVCPPPRTIEGAPPAAAQPLIWSPTGRYALLIAAQPETSGELLRYDPENEAWKSLAQSVISAAWSPDGRVIAYTDGTDVFLVLAEGGRPRSMLAGQLPLAAGHVRWLAWQDGQRLLVLVSRAAGQTVYLVDVPTGSITEVLQRPPKGGSAPEPSPDGERWAMVLQEDARSHLLVNAAGAQGSPTVSFLNSTIWPLVWSPDGARLAFNVSYRSGETEIDDLYVTQAEGGALQQVFRGSTAPLFAWSPDGRGLVVESTGAQGRTHLVLISLETGQSRVLQAEGLDLAWDWIRPAWRK